MPSYAVTGASRGIGYALVEQLSTDPSNVVFAIVRNTTSVQEKVSKELPERQNIHVIHGDLTNFASLEAAAKYVSTTTGGSLDMLIANAAVVTLGFDPIGEEVTQDPAHFDKIMLDNFNVNVIGNIHLMHIFTPLIKRGSLKKVVAVSSGMGDPDFVVEAGVKMQAPYAISKAGLNMAIAKFHVQYKDEGILFMSISPGLVETGGYDIFEKTPEYLAQLEEMGAIIKAYASSNFKGHVTPEEAAKLLLGVIDQATIEKNGGRMVSHMGTTKWL